MVVVVALAAGGVLAAPDCSLERLRKCNTIESAIKQKKWPSTDAEVVAACDTLHKGGACLKQFNDECAKTAKGKLLINGLLMAMKKYDSEVCSSPSGRKQFLDRTKCYSKPAFSKGMHDMHSRYVAMIEAIEVDVKTVKERKESVCCAMRFGYDKAMELGKKNCDASVADYLKNIMKKIVST